MKSSPSLEAAAETTTVEATATKASAVEPTTTKATTKATAVATTTASTATASKTGLGRRECKAEADHLTECYCFHGER